MMEIAATSMDGFLAYWSRLTEVSGHIHSVFQRAVNIRTSGGQLISVVSSEGVNGPNTVVTDLPHDFDFSTMGLKSGMPMRLGKGGGDLGGGTVSISVSAAQKWWPRLADGAEHLDKTRLKRNLSYLVKTLPKREPSEGIGNLFCVADKMVSGHWSAVRRLKLNKLTRQALPGMRALLEGMLGRDENLLKRGLRGLLGLGPGLTPSGDDLLMGFIGTLSLISRRVGGPEVTDLLEVIKRQLMENKDRTTFVSGSLLSYACAGRIFSTALSVVRALIYGKPSEARSAAENLMRLGAGSGREVLLGIVLAISLVPHLGEG
jgi:hypothetical protein